jgi:CIC family chloride channel protein
MPVSSAPQETRWTRIARKRRALGRLGRRVSPLAPTFGLLRLWFRSAISPTEQYLFALSIVIGVLTGFGSVGFVKLLHVISDFAQGSIASALGIFGPANLVLLPALGGLMVGPIIARFAKEAKGHGVPEVMTALAVRRGHIRTRVAFVKVIASSLTIGFGGAAGREGPMVQIGATIGSMTARLSNLPAHKVRAMVACGAAGGVAATFNAPIAGAIFAVEVLMGRIRTDFLHILLTSLTSCLIAQTYLGKEPAFLVPNYELVSPGEVGLYLIMGLLLGFAAIGYVRLLYWSEDFFDSWRFPDWLKPAIGGLMVGVLLRYYPQIYGSGFPAIKSALWVEFPWELLAVLFVVEMIGNCATLGSGGSGGVFAPALYMGAMAGGAFGSLAHVLYPAWTAGSGAYALVGMAAFFAATAKAPMTSILILFEMTDDARIMLPLMAATAASVAVSNRLTPFSVYTLKLHNRGISFPFDERAEGRTPPKEPRGADVTTPTPPLAEAIE